jgi:hypothetical protein
MTGMPAILYFPYIDLDAEACRSLLTLFQEIRILQPAFSVPSAWTEQAQKRGWIRIERPLPLELDARAARALLREYERLGRLYQDSGYLAYLKHGGGHRLEEEPGYGLVREIRGYGTSPAPLDGQETLRGQILLQMAQDLDRQRREIRETLADLHRQEGTMLRSLGVGLDEEETLEHGTEPLPSVEEDDFLIPQRLRAWGEMLAAWTHPAPSILFTDNQLVMDHLMERAAKQRWGGRGGPVGLLRVSVPRFMPADLDETGRIRASLFHLLPWQIFCERLEEWLRDAMGTRWDDAAQRDLPSRGRALSSYFKDSVWEGLLERVASLEPTWTSGWHQSNLHFVLFPGWTHMGLIRGEGEEVEPSDCRNAIVVHLEEGVAEDAPWGAEPGGIVH